jgi:hypothetical protein
MNLTNLSQYLYEKTTKLINYMKNLLKKIGNFLRNVIKESVDIVEQKAPLAVRLVQKIKEAIEHHNGSIEWVLNETATEQDNETFIIIKDKLPLVVKELATIEELVSEEATVEEAIASYMEYIASKTKKSRAKEYILLSAMLLQALITKKLPLEILIVITQKAYHLIFGKKE